MARESGYPAAGVASNAPDLKRILGDAYSAFSKLKQFGCDEGLDRLLVLLSCRSARVHSPKGKEWVLELRRADSHELMLGGLSLKQARAKIAKARRALKAIEAELASLDNVALWWRAAESGTAWRQERRVLMAGLTARLDEFSRVLRRIGPKAHPDVSRKIERTIRYVHERTGQYHDAEVAEVLSAAMGMPVPPGYPEFPDALSLKAWRRKHGLAGKSGILKA
jgi:hypothetical protein